MNIPVWGCPAHALQPTLQDGKKLSKWKPRSRRAQFVGWSPLHASSVAWVRNLQTGRVSPQFHVIFDNWFETVELDNEEETPLWSHHRQSNRFGMSCVEIFSEEGEVSPAKRKQQLVWSSIEPQG